MKRRSLLTSLCAATVGLSGCADARTDTATPSGTAPITPSPTTTPQPDLHWAVDPLAEATPDHPGRVAITLSNNGGPAELTIAGKLPLPPRPGDPVSGDDDSPVPVLLPVESGYDREYDGNCWESPLDRPGIADDAPWDMGHGAGRTVRMAPGDQFRGVYEIVASWTSYCFPDGIYHFERHYELDGELHEETFELELPLRIET